MNSAQDRRHSLNEFTPKDFPEVFRYQVVIYAKDDYILTYREFPAAGHLSSMIDFIKDWTDVPRASSIKVTKWDKEGNRL